MDMCSIVRVSTETLVLPRDYDDIWKPSTALAGVAQWIERCPADWKGAGLITGQGTGLGFGLGPQLGLCEKQPISVSLAHRCFPLYFSLPFHLPKKKKKKI